MRAVHTITSLTTLTASMHAVLIASCPVAETSTVDTCPWHVDSNHTTSPDTGPVARTRHYTGQETFCGDGSRRTWRDFDTFHQYMQYHMRLARIRSQTATNRLVSDRTR